MLYKRKVTPNSCTIQFNSQHIAQKIFMYALSLAMNEIIFQVKYCLKNFSGNATESENKSFCLVLTKQYIHTPRVLIRTFNWLKVFQFSCSVHQGRKSSRHKNWNLGNWKSYNWLLLEMKNTFPVLQMPKNVFITAK